MKRIFFPIIFILLKLCVENRFCIASESKEDNLNANSPPLALLKAFKGRLERLEREMRVTEAELTGFSRWNEAVKTAENDHVALNWIQKMMKRLRTEMDLLYKDEAEKRTQRKLAEKRRNERIEFLEKQFKELLSDNKRAFQYYYPESFPNPQKKRARKRKRNEARYGKRLLKELDHVTESIHRLTAEQRRLDKMMSKKQEERKKEKQRQ